MDDAFRDFYKTYQGAARSYSIAPALERFLPLAKKKLFSSLKVTSPLQAY